MVCGVVGWLAACGAASPPAGGGGGAADERSEYDCLDRFDTDCNFVRLSGRATCGAGVSLSRTNGDAAVFAITEHPRNAGPVVKDDGTYVALVLPEELGSSMSVAAELRLFDWTGSAKWEVTRGETPLGGYPVVQCDCQRDFQEIRVRTTPVTAALRHSYTLDVHADTCPRNSPADDVACGDRPQECQ
jgi:hypothetical protein